MKWNEVFGSVITLFLPLFGYLIAFVFQVGFFTFFGIPYHFIEVGVIPVLIAVSSYLLFLLILFQPLLMFFMVYKSIDGESSIGWFVKKKVLLYGGMTLILYILYVSGIVKNFKALIIIAGLTLGPHVIADFLMPLVLIRQNNGVSGLRGYLKKIVESDKRESRVNHRMVGDVGSKYFLYGSVILLITSFAYVSGHYAAKTKTDFYTLKKNGESFVILTQYSSMFVTARLDSTGLAFYKEFKLIPIDENITITKTENLVVAAE